MLNVLYYIIFIPVMAYLALIVLGCVIQFFESRKPKCKKENVSAMTFLRYSSSTDKYDEILADLDATEDYPECFGYKISWLAIKTEDAQKVVDVLRMDHVHRANWSSGVFAAYDGFTFVSPPIKGWVLVVGPVIPENIEYEGHDDHHKFMHELASEFKEVQYYGSHRGVGYYGWSKYVDGEEVRRCCFSEVGVYQKGEITTEELYLDKDLAFMNYSDDFKDDLEDNLEDIEIAQSIDEDDVLQMAELWSINPDEFSEMEEGDYDKGVGYLGDLTIVAQD